MKNSILLFVCLAFLFSCERNYKPDYSRGFFEAEINGEYTKFEIGILELINEKVFVSFVRKNTQGFNRMALSFNAIPIDIGSYPLSIYITMESDSIAAGLLILDGDGIEDTYSPTEDIQTSYVEVLSYTNNSMEGICNVEFSLDGNPGNLDNPAIYSFENGRLSITVP